MTFEMNMEQLEAMCDWADLHHTWEAEPWEDGKPPWMSGEPCPAGVEARHDKR